ncbi:TonB-dependent receptor [Tahibacter amnicola]|uniref:TonB-dependent receptor n=1 Tax=Tahibacter amnicola TaxID=2976241 RepID=A0ABY6BI51_9GAMM|nr:TonB-dependent receptor [Tahibacter amnicola]UXI69510.1 TonB-dependent receptor [Tahibacter amnicola]
MNKRLRVRVLPLMLASLLASTPTFAQNTSAAMSGRITDSSGNPVAGATVEIVHVPSNTTKSVTTDADGRFNARGLRVGGPFIVDAEKSGMAKVEKKDVFLKLAEDTTVDLTMGAEASTLEAVEVTATAASTVFLADNKGLTTNVSNQQIQSFPSISRSIQDYVRLDPRITQTDKERGEISAAGQNSRYNNIKIDAVSTNDEFGLEATGLPSQGGTQPISIDTIEEFNISTADFDVTNSRAVGASINAVTKSGTNDFKGSVYFTYRDPDLIGENEQGVAFTGFSKQTNKGMTFGGPIIKDTLFFFLNYEEYERTDVAPDVGVRGSGATNEAGVTQAQLDRIISIAKTKWGFDPGTLNPGGDLSDKKYLAKFDWNINDYHRASFRYNKIESTVPVLERLTGGQVSLSSWWYDKTYDFENYVVNLYDDWSENFSTETSLSFSKYANASPTYSQLPAMHIAVAGTEGAANTSVFLGTERSRQANALDVDTWNFYWAGDWFVGDHTIKFGADYKKNDTFNLFLQDFYGNYAFASIDDFEAGRYSPIPSGFSGGLIGGNAFQLNVPIGGDARNAAADWALAQFGLFVQDTWQATPNLSIKYGIRMDQFMTGDEPTYNAAVEPVFNYRNDATIDGRRVWQPRLGFNYTFDTERSTQLRGGIGLFQGSNPGVWLSNSYSNTGLLFTTYQTNQPGTNFTPDPFNQPTANANPRQTLSLTSPNFHAPSVWKFALAFDHELPFWGLIGSAEYLYLDVRDAVQFSHLNLGAPTGKLPDGRDAFWRNINTASGSRSGANTRFGDVILLRNTHEGKASNLTLGLEKPFNDNWSARLGYSYGNASEANVGSSSVALSNWNSLAVYNANENLATTGAAEIQQRFTAALSWRKSLFGDYNTTMSAFYEGRAGRPFSYTFTNDANGDGNSGNDLFYVPVDANDVIIADATQATNFWNYIQSNEYLNSRRGQVVSRNGARSKWINQIDLRFSQELPGFFEGNKGEFWVDILNFTNLLNKKWGHIDEAPFRANGGQSLGVAQFGGVDPTTGKYIYRYPTAANSMITKDNTGESRWAIQMGVRYTF